MHVATNSIVYQCKKGLARKHVPQADAEKRSILIDASRTESTDMNRIGHKRCGQHRYRGIQ